MDRWKAAEDVLGVADTMRFLQDEGGLQVGSSSQVIYGAHTTQTRDTGGLLMVVVCQQIHRVPKLSSLINSLVIHARLLIESVGI